MTRSRRPTPQLRVAEVVAAELRDRILSSPPDDEFRLPTQDALVKEFGVSYPSVREAIRILETEGLLTVRRGNVGGAEVHRPDESSAAYHLGLVLQSEQVTLGDLAAGLQQLEPLCAAACARRRDRHRTVVPQLRANLDAAGALTGAGPSFTSTAREFHDLVVGGTPNRTMRVVVGSLVALWSVQEELWAQSLARRNEYPTEREARAVVRTHARITDEIEAGNADAAESMARTHLVATQRFLVDRFDDGLVHARAGVTGPAAAGGTAWRL